MNAVEQKPIISKRKARQRKIAELVVKGEHTLAEIAKETGSESKYPRQSVYSSIRQPGVQAEIAKIQAESGYTVDKCLAELDEAQEMARKRKIPAVMVQAVSVKAKVAGLMIERIADVTDRRGLEDRAGATLSRLMVSDKGISENVQPSATSGECVPVLNTDGMPLPTEADAKLT